jgi:hypothetical protein
MLVDVRRADEGIATSADWRHFHLIRHQRSASVLSDASVFECQPVCLFQHRRLWSYILTCFTNVYEKIVGDRKGRIQDRILQKVPPERLRKTRTASAKKADSWMEFEPYNTWVQFRRVVVVHNWPTGLVWLRWYLSDLLHQVGLNWIASPDIFMTNKITNCDVVHRSYQGVPCFQNVVLFRDTRLSLIWFTSVRKVRPHQRRFTRNLQCAAALCVYLLHWISTKSDSTCGK